MSNNPFSLGQHNTTPPTLTDGQVNPLQLDVSGELIVAPVEITDGTDIIGTLAHPIRVDPTGTTPQPVTGTFFQATQPVSIAASATTVANAASLTVANVKASPGILFGLTVVNTTAAALYIQLYDTAGTPVLGTGVVSWIPVAASGVLVIAPGFLGLESFATGIGIGAATTPTGAVAPGTAPDVTVWYV